MSLRICIAVCVISAIIGTEAYVKRDVKDESSSVPPNVLESLQNNLDQFRKCLDQTMAKTVDEINVQHLKPVFNVIGDQLNRFSRAFEDLTATTKKPDKDLDF